ncbi:MAG: hypothetical protein AUJ08_04685 [Thaumarchaeota archaeon 13_1_40CM_3_50_5]|nr:MAG: hypothetical protein AUJ08_04685 [Thaumarchaeota archaeon 13_1_40CM_3_50_5]
MSNDRDHEDPVINDVLDETAEKESIMSEKEIKLRDQLNEELSQKGLHLRLAFLRVNDERFGFDFVRPIDQWFDEWPETDRYITERLYELVRSQ